MKRRSGEPLNGGAVIYYSLVTLTTQGYGDIVPASGYARLLASLEGVAGTVYLAVLIASLVTGLRRRTVVAKPEGAEARD